MLRYIISALIAFILLALAVIWVLSGGPRTVITNVQASIDRATPKEGEVDFKLPWQPAQLFPTLDLSNALDITVDDNQGGIAHAQQQLADLEAEYDRLNAEAQKTRSFGNPSPFVGHVAIVQDLSGIRADSVQQEYLQIAANFSNTSSIDIAGWTLESALSGVRVVIPPGASPFIANSANVLGPVVLDPGGLALVASAPSPVGVSFRENACSGYLDQFQAFAPPLADDCPAPSSVLPLTEENLSRYGDACFDAIQNLSSCRFPQHMTGVSGACQAYLAQNLSYNGCVTANRFRTTFQKNMWRVYLGSTSELWRNSHDAIRLLDSQGRTVSVFVY